MKIEYTLNEKEIKKYKEFRKRKDAELLEEQRASMDPEEFKSLTCDGQWPYIGASGGGITWNITYTSIGTGISVTIYGEECNLTDYESW